MRYPTAQDIEEMKANGYDTASIAEQEKLVERGTIAAKLKEDIKRAFQGISLGSGIGLHEADGIDDYANEDTLSKYRALDERNDWSAISIESLNHCNSSPSYFDAEGFRFHIPAYLIADIDGNYSFDITFHLCLPITEEKYSLLNPEQKIVIRNYLQFIIEKEDHSFQREHIQRALDEYWSK